MHKFRRNYLHVKLGDRERERERERDRERERERGRERERESEPRCSYYPGRGRSWRVKIGFDRINSSNLKKKEKNIKEN